MLYWHYAAALTILLVFLLQRERIHFRAIPGVMKLNSLHEPSRKSHLAYEKQLTQKLDLDEFLSVFSNKSRRLQL